MEEHIERNKRVLEQWERFHRQEPVDESAVRPLILRSWKRCRLQGVRPDNASKVSLSPAALEKAARSERGSCERWPKASWKSCITPSALRAASISLSDAQGIVLHALWDNTGSYPIPHLAPGQPRGGKRLGDQCHRDVPRGTYACGDAGFGTLLPLVPRLVLLGGPHQGQPERHRRRAQCDAPERPVPSPYPGDDGSGGPRHRGTAPPAGCSFRNRRPSLKCWMKGWSCWKATARYGR